MRKIVQFRPAPELATAWAAALDVAATPVSDVFRRHGITMIGDRIPVPIYNYGASRNDFELGASLADATASFAAGNSDGFAVAAEIPQGAEAQLLADASVMDIFADPVIEPVVNCDFFTAVGSFTDVATGSGTAALNARDLRGQNVRVAVIDSGIDGTLSGPAGKPLADSVDATQVVAGSSPGRAARGHGTMCAFDVLVGAPEARLIDVPLFTQGSKDLTGFLSDALRYYANLLELFKKTPSQPLVLSNSWAVFSLATDAPVGSPENYSSNPRHLFNLMVGTLVDAGIDVLFCAGNCGGDCPDRRCTAGSIGAGKDIHGANSHGSVISVGAVSVHDERCGYSSQGPGDLDPQKPDVMAFSQFAGSHVTGVDAGTSAACPVATGAVAALRTQFTSTAPQTLRSALRNSARQPGARPWNADFGFGILDAGAAFTLLTSSKA